jgi:integrase
MKFSVAIDLYIADQRRDGRINSPRSEVSYRQVLNLHADDVSNRDPRTTGRNDCKRTLARWPNPNTLRGRRAVLVSFYRWCMEEGIRKDNPAEQTRRPKKRPHRIYRLNADEVATFLQAAHGTLERRAAYLGICAGLRAAELRGLQGRHFQRPGFVWVSADISKGNRERWVPVIPDLQPIVEEIRSDVAPSEYVLCGQVNSNPPFNTRPRLVPSRPMGGTTLYRLIRDLAKRAGIKEHIHPHLMRHAYGDHVTRHTGIQNARALMGHADIKTTQGYVGNPLLDELVDAVAGLRFDYPLAEGASNPEWRRRELNPRSRPSGLPRGFDEWLGALALRAVQIYGPRFMEPADA